jgi:hypothetical protein
MSKTAIDTSASEFYQAKSLAYRIVTLLRSERRTPEANRLLEQYPFPIAELANCLEDISPECEQVCEEICQAPATDLQGLEDKLRKELHGAEQTSPEQIEELERLLLRPVCFEQVLAQELEDIKKLRKARDRENPEKTPDGDSTNTAHSAKLCGLALSGGGVRSATFNLGMLQGMAKHDVLRRVDYLSVVSGGGYIGGWLTAWIKRTSFEKVNRDLKDEGQGQRSELQPIAFLRDYGSYLTPQIGILSADTWTAFMTWIRNTLLNLLVLLPGLAALLLVPRLLKALIEEVNTLLAARDHMAEESTTVIAVACQILIILRVIHNLRLFETNGSRRDGRPNLPAGFGDPHWNIQKFIILPALIAAWLSANRLWDMAFESTKPINPETQPTHLVGLGVMVFFCFLLLVLLQVKGGYVQCYLREAKSTKRNRRIARFLCVLLPLITSGIKAGILAAIYYFFKSLSQSDPASFNTHVAVWGIPLVLADFSLCITVHIGLMGRNLPDDRREWWSRVAAYLGIYAVALFALFGASFYGPWLASTSAQMSHFHATAILAWAVTTGVGVFVATSRKSESKEETEAVKTKFIVRAVLTGAPFVFMVGLVVGIATGAHELLLWAQPPLHSLACGPPTSWVCRSVGELSASKDYFHRLESISPAVELGFFVILGFIAYWMSRAVDINEFSMHHFYRNRLIRAYLGASHCQDRAPNRLTGFDNSDDLLLASLRPECEPGLRRNLEQYTGPYPIFNTALNLITGERLSWQERKATSFFFTPKFCGYDYIPQHGTRAEAPLREAGYRPTSAYAYSDGGVHLGTAMAISGAAASPNAGLYTSTAMAFLLTVFNVRLGWWMGNPRHDLTWRRSGPRNGLMYLVRELLGMANDRQRHVYLSDGGHFENLGIYELVRRRCSLIIACDAEEDSNFSFAGLGGVIRKCFVDFGVRIKLDDFVAIRPDPGKTLSSRHSIQGTIAYPEGWTGTLIYIKASLTGDEPADLQAYLAKHQGFPHQSTADQFFEESQFESYHRLGLHISKEVFQAWSPQKCEWQGKPEAKRSTPVAISHMGQPDGAAFAKTSSTGGGNY